MKPIKINLPIKYKGSYLQLKYEGKTIFLQHKGNTYYFILNPRLLYMILFLLILTICYQLFQPNLTNPPQTTQISINGDNTIVDDDVLGYFLEFFSEVQEFHDTKETSDYEAFLVNKQILISKYIVQNRVSRLDQLNNETLLNLNQDISKLFCSLVLNKIKIESHVYKYFTDTSDLKKIETALMEQIKYNVPASIKLAQSALETAYGQRIINNNYFGIKDKSQSISPITTTEYYTNQEVQINQHKILYKEKIIKNGKELFKCKVKDHFSSYKSPWESFRAHSIYLVNNRRYSPLFTNGKNFELWADKIGSTKYGGVGYATSPIYGELLKKIIKRYHLDLLDY